MEKRIKTALTELLNGTKNGTFSWEPSERTTEYRLRLQYGIITVDSWTAVDDDGDESECADVAFHNASGEVIERFVFNDSAKDIDDYQFMLTIHSAARRNSLKVDETLNRIFSEITTKTQEPPLPF